MKFNNVKLFMSLGNNDLNKNCLLYFGNNGIFRFSQKYSKNFILLSLALSVKKTFN